VGTKKNTSGVFFVIELKPCPFCGGEAEFERLGTRRQSCIVVCTECGCHHESSDENEHNGSSWNRRVGDKE
jgi:Lar family restriction alleviation protein